MARKVVKATVERLLPTVGTPEQLFAHLITAAEHGTTAMNLTVHTEGELGSHCFHANHLAMAIAQLLTFSRHGKDRRPICDYDPDLVLALNGRGFFSSAVGFYFDKQRNYVLETVVAGESATMLFTNEYGLQHKSAPRARIWTVNYALYKGTLWTTVVFGATPIFPSLLYDIASIEAMSIWFRDMVKASRVSYTWLFHQLIGNGAPDLFSNQNDVVLRTIPDPAEVAEVLRLEVISRTEKLNTPPIPRIPFSPELMQLHTNIHAYWSEKNERR